VKTLARWALIMGGVLILASCRQAADDTVTVRSAVNSNVVVTVRDAAGTLLSGIQVLARRNSGAVSGDLVTNASGQVTFSLAANSYRFDAWVPNMDFYSGAVGHCVTPSCTTASITVTRVDVSVVDTTGAPLANHQIAWETPQGTEGGWVDTAANGHAVMGVAAGSYRFGDELNGYTFY
jgi:hypothetical protein